MPSDKVPWAKVEVTADAVEKMSELAAEVERLRTEMKQRIEASAERTRIDGAEVKRLRAELRVAKDTAAYLLGGGVAKDNERLRAALERIAAAPDDTQHLDIARQALRLREAERGWYERTNEVMHLNAEVKRLRAENEGLTNRSQQEPIAKEETG